MAALWHCTGILDKQQVGSYLLVQKFPRQATGNVFSSSSVISSSGVEKPSSVQEEER